MHTKKYIQSILKTDFFINIHFVTMNNDIIYEILKNLYEKPEENGGALLAKKIIPSRTDFQKLEELNFEKPVVFEIDLSRLVEKDQISRDPLDYLTAERAAYYYADRKNCYLFNIVRDKTYLIKVYKYKNNVSIIRKDIIVDVHSIGNMTSLERMFFGNYDFNKIVGSKLDTSKVLDMSAMFYGCHELNQNIGKNWNVSNVIYTSLMFCGCSKLNKNIGKNWNTSKVQEMSYMFSGCINLDKNIGKKMEY